MADDTTRGANLTERLRRASGYDPVRPARLIRSGADARALPQAGERAVDRFGSAAEDGLRMLAALETMPSLEPDYCDDLAEEASISIVERTPNSGGDAGPSDAEDAPARSLRSRLEDVIETPGIVADEYAAYQGFVEEATVEIVELPDHRPEASLWKDLAEDDDSSKA